MPAQIMQKFEVRKVRRMHRELGVGAHGSAEELVYFSLQWTTSPLVFATPALEVVPTTALLEALF